MQIQEDSGIMFDGHRVHPALAPSNNPTFSLEFDAVNGQLVEANGSTVLAFYIPWKDDRVASKFLCRFGRIIGLCRDMPHLSWVPKARHQPSVAEVSLVQAEQVDSDQTSSGQNFAHGLSAALLVVMVGAFAFAAEAPHSHRCC